MSTYPRSAARRGFTIIDTLIALAVVIGAVVGLIGVIPYSFSQIEYDSIAVQADAVGQQFLDQIRQDVQSGAAVPASASAPIDFGQSFSGAGPDSVTGNFSLTSSCSALGGSALTQDCTVTVQWTENGTRRQTLLESYITGQVY